MNFPCAVEADLNRYLRKLDADDARSAAVERCAEEYLAAEYSPSNPDNVAEALAEIIHPTLVAVAGHIGKSLGETNSKARDDHYLMIGLQIATAVENYWTAMAQKKAADDIDSASCRYCFDRGCHRCEPDDTFHFND